MGDLTAGYTWVNGANVTPARLNAMLADAVIVADAVSTAKILDAAVTTAKILDANVTTAKVADAAITTAKILDANVTAAKVATDAITTAKILAANVTAPKLDGVGKDISGANLSVGTAPVFGCRAWVLFDGTRNAADSGVSVSGGTVKIFGAGNVTSVVRTGSGTGRFTINFTTAMAHSNYAVVGNYNDLNSDVRAKNDGQTSAHTRATGSVQVVSVEGSGTEAEAVRTSVAVFC